MVYTSNATGKLRQDDVFTIVQKSVSNNMAREVTGFLIYDGGRFLQFIEGADDDLRNLLTTLRADDRHENITVLVDEPTSERRFGRWRMQRVTKDDACVQQVRHSLAATPGGRVIMREVDTFLGL